MSAEIKRQFEAHGLDCVVLWVHDSHFCGYVRIPEDHPDFGKDYDDVPVKVHGGLTFAGKLTRSGLDGEFVGFDCAHSGDATGWFASPGDHAWTEDEVAAECTKLAAQIADRAEVTA